MKLSEVVKKYDFHDSIIENIQYLKEKDEISMNVELCNWRQQWYKEYEPEMIKIKLIFSEVKKYETNKTLGTFINDEILKIELLENEFQNNEAIKIVLLGGEDVNILKIVATDVNIN